MSVTAENARPGDGGWWTDHAPAATIEGYASWPSVRPGGRLQLHVSTAPVARYVITVHRLGWYGGAGGRVVLRHPTTGSAVGQPRAVPSPSAGLAVPSADWPVTDSVPVGDWPSGQYVARLTLTSGEHAGRSAPVPFVVREPAGRRAPLLVQMPVTTAAAYNHWGGKSLYPSNSTDGIAAVKVSLDRPIPFWHDANLNARWPFVWDVQLVRFLEREGHEIGYTTDVDVHAEPWTLAGRRLLMTSGHDEYWTYEMRDAWDAALAAGTNLAFMGANTAYWQCRLEEDGRTMVQYRDAGRDPEPSSDRKTVRFRDLQPPRPEAALMGVQYDNGVKTPQDPVRAYTVTAAHDPWLTGTGLVPGEVLEDRVGYEWDAIAPTLAPAGEQTILLHHEDAQLSDADCVRTYADTGAVVFAAGTLQWSWALDDWAHPGHANERLQQLMRNALAELLA